MSMGLAMQPPVQGMTFGVVQRRSAKASRCRTDRESPRRVSAGDTSLTVKKKEEGVKEMEILFIRVRSRTFRARGAARETPRARTLARGVDLTRTAPARGLDSRDASARKDSFRDASHRVARIFLVAFASASDSRRVARASTSGATATRPVSLTVSSRLVSSRLVSRMTTSIDTPDCLPIEIRTLAT